MFSDNPYSGNPATGRYKLFVACSGARAPPITVTRDGGDGLWEAHGWSSLAVGVRVP